MEMSIWAVTNHQNYHSGLERTENGGNGVMIHLTLEPLESKIIVISSVTLYLSQIMLFWY